MRAFFILLKNDTIWIWGGLAFSIYIGVQCVFMSGRDEMFHLYMNSNGSNIFLLIIPSMGMNVFLAGSNFRTKSPNAWATGTPEFFFSRAINRFQMFGAKSTIYLGLVLLPLTIIYVHSFVKPLVRIELPYSPPGARAVTKDFYLQHFEGSYVQANEKDKKDNQVYVVLPSGKIDVTIFTAIWALTAALILEIAIFSLPPGNPTTVTPTMVFIVLLILATYLGWPSSKTPSYYESGVGWVAQHTFLVFLGLALFTTLSQFYCCRRFVRSEIIS